MARIYRTPIPARVIQTISDSVSQELATLNQLQASELIEQISSGAADLTIDGQYRAAYAHRLGVELEELLTSASIESVPLYDFADGKDGYYTADLAEEAPVDAQTDVADEVRATLRRQGTRTSKWLGVRPTPSEVDNPYVGDDRPIVGLPSAARRVRAVNAASAPTQRELGLDPVATVTGEHGDVDRYDLDTIGIDDPILLYDLAYDRQGDVDVGVWDTFGTDTILDTDGIVQWQRVFDPAHEFAPSAAAVIENGLLRIWINAPDDGDETASLEAERWDDGTSSWSSVSIPSYNTDLDTDWQPAALILSRIGQARITGQLEFEAVAGTNTGDVYAVDVQLDRGDENLLITIPDAEPDPIPTDLEALLDPIASPRIIDTGASQTLVDRQEVSK